MTVGIDLNRYEKLLIQYHPRPIAGGEDLEAAQAVLDELLALKRLSPEQQAILELVTSVIEEYERAKVSVPAVPARDLIRFLLEERGMRQRDLEPIFGTESIVSEVLSGRRELQRKHIAGLSKLFQVSPAAFFHDLPSFT